jgi:TatD DNase family protein
MTDQPIRARAATDVDGRRRDRSRPPAPEPLPHPVVDTHCHLDIADHDVVDGWDAAAAIAAATDAGVTRIVQIGCDLPSARWAVAAARSQPTLVAGVALHPNEAPRLADLGDLAAAYDEIEALAADPVVRVVGETGLDFFRTTGREALAVQRESFAWHVDLAKRLGKTLQIHDRDSHAAVLDLLDAEGAPERVVMHCFSGDVAFARACVDRGFWLSFAGTVTFRNAPELRTALAATPISKVLVETDAPFLTPMPYRGRPNASYLVPVTVRAMAQARGDDLADLCAALDANATTAFGGPWPAA